MRIVDVVLCTEYCCPHSPLFYPLEHAKRMESFLWLALIFISVQTFILVYIFVWLHIPRIVDHQRRFLVQLTEQILLELAKSAEANFLTPSPPSSQHLMLL